MIRRKLEASPVIDGKQDMFVAVDGVRIAQRGYPNTPHAATWVSIEPGWDVLTARRQSPSGIAASACTKDAESVS